ncbi:TPA: isocitrate lyase/phosphoenolpyruvate mutase family protein [Burkholderia cepacia]|uniref:isocitrate lyase/PEP mutase family protein n=1 Tax=Burkholderia cepacia TaxID=292 RepID=UPI001C932DA1|nr:isocitrate lyase/phosphoenolpyruvate mutase family protein [Burkholderia cepacia]HDR9763327.1 isocitrate lyase/phosphoenolpyruvate mutase family protein [Burkholderia cepacia ATCC 25416]MBY4708734.1 isocitrate lyase/phosphoenolpyruvate mutase family protein [Burkholderia cepacia]MBY4735755.1 isocitrate lyase/phosphoenolpyruvate mutase family protein [Burkholderia cepacia]MBY4742759.1 isocitrate lyase/phosphoenolpyruvate mutase family protein [Burkholderia cepacia]MBY4756914.1 isocitrate lya
MKFAQLHQQKEPLLLANVWDAASARAAEAAGYAALGTSSAAIADLLGYADGEGVSFPELKALVARLRSVSDLPLTVDVEAGYGATPEAVVANLRELAALGVAGVNLEDSVVRDGQRTLVDAETFSRRLHDINTGLLASGVKLFLNVRTDTFLLGVAHAREETLARGRRYAESGANGLFVPCVTDEADIAAIVDGISLPLNVMCMPNLPSFERLAALGVKRVSMGNFLHQRALQALQQLFIDVRANQSFGPVFEHASH